VAKNNRAFASFRALRETILRGKTIREFVVILRKPPFFPKSGFKKKIVI